MARIVEYMAKVKTVKGTDAATYLGFNTPTSSQLKFSDKVPGWRSGFKYIGEWSAQTDKPNGRGIKIYSWGSIYIGQYKDGKSAAGNYIFIWSDDTLSVGENYVNANGVLKWRGTEYNQDGTTEKFDSGK